MLAEYREQRIDAAILLGSFHDIAPTLALVEVSPHPYPQSEPEP